MSAAVAPAASLFSEPAAKQTGHLVDKSKAPWIEKYRPTTLDDVVSQDQVTDVLKKTLRSSDLPHLLCYGPAGTGKTSTILAMARDLYGPDLLKLRVLELNASDERGIAVVREKIKTFARETPRHIDGPSSDGKVYPCPPFKLVLLDEADNMTQDAQSALRRIMETYSTTTRFCLICNYVTRIIDPVASRCSKFRFKPLDSSSTTQRIQMIAETEGVQLEEGVLPLILELSEGDMRKAITYMQTGQRLHQAQAKPTPISADSIVEIAGVVPQSVINSLLHAIGIDPESGMLEPKGRNGFNDVMRAVKAVSREGYSASQVLTQLHDAIILHPTIPSLPKSLAGLAIGETDYALTNGAEEELQLWECCLRIQAALQRKL